MTDKTRVAALEQDIPEMLERTRPTGADEFSKLTDDEFQVFLLLVYRAKGLDPDGQDGCIYSTFCLADRARKRAEALRRLAAGLDAQADEHFAKYAAEGSPK